LKGEEDSSWGTEDRMGPQKESGPILLWLFLPPFGRKEKNFKRAAHRPKPFKKVA